MRKAYIGLWWGFVVLAITGMVIGESASALACAVGSMVIALRLELMDKGVL